MFTEELKLIKEAEEQADKMRKEAKIAAKNSTEETDERANQMIEEAFSKEKEQCQALIKDGQKIADELYRETIETAQALSREIDASACKKQNEAIRFIAERIVDSSVDC